jgi:hypothetical protein
VVRLDRHRMPAHSSLARAAGGDSVLADLRGGPAVKLNLLGTSPMAGHVPSRHSLGPTRARAWHNQRSYS